MALILNDTFTESSDTRVDLHTGETGATWAPANSDQSGGTIFYPIVDAGVDELRGGNTANNQHFYASASPANADQKITATFRRRAASTGQWTGVILRMDHTAGVAALTGYVLFYINAATPYFRLYKIVSGAGTQLGSDYVHTLAASDVDVDFYAVGSELRVYMGSTLIISATDSAITAAGKLGVRFSDYAVSGAGNGVNFSRLQGWDSATLEQIITVGTAAESDTAGTITPSSDVTVSVGTATETDTAAAVVGIFDQTVSVGTATETNTAAVATVETVSGTRAQGGLAWLFRSGSAPASQSVPIGTAVETDTAFAVTIPPDQTITVGTATETDSAVAVSIAVAQTIAVGTATETDTAGAVTQTVPGTVVIHPQGMVPGTVIGAYRRWEWRGPVAAKLNAGPGAVVEETTVSDELTATFTLDRGEYVAYAEDYPTRRLFFMVTETD